MTEHLALFAVIALRSIPAFVSLLSVHFNSGFDTVHRNGRIAVIAANTKNRTV